MISKSGVLKNVVLYADDDPDDIWFVQEAFKKYSDDVEVITFPDGENVIEYLMNLSIFDPTPCLIILDINMPRLNGKETLQKIRQLQRFKDIPILFYTTSSYITDRNFAKSNSAGFVTKPLSEFQMVKIVDQFLEYCTDDVRARIGRKKN